ncbi:hypothetical protein L204_104696 [Cryptococcus depauperatus]|nr:hypothetical protein L204_03564 [Cryptococcus depauperatus CBS 7855]
MKISNTAPQHLSNREVLNHFLSLKQDNDSLSQSINLKKSRDKALAKRLYPLEKDRDDKNEDDLSLLDPLSAGQEKELQTADRRGLSDELVWIQDEVIKYLCSDLVPTARQTIDGVAKLANELQDHQLTKAEVLQLVNLAPGEPVTLYSIIEEADTRFYPNPAEKLDAIGNQIYETLLPAPPAELLPYISEPGNAASETVAYEAGYVNADVEMEEMAMMQDQEYVFETGKEVGVDEEQDGDMD